MFLGCLGCTPQNIRATAASWRLLLSSAFWSRSLRQPALRVTGLEGVAGAPGHFLQHEGVAVGVAKVCVFDSAARAIIDLADVDAAADQFLSGVVDVAHDQVQALDSAR